MINIINKIMITSLCSMGTLGFSNTLKVVGLNNVRRTPLGVRVNYELPCGATRKGFVVVPAGEKRLRLFVLLEQAETSCLRLPISRQEHLSFLSNKFAYTSKAPKYILQPAGKLELVSLQKVQTLKREGQWINQIIIERSCAKLAGFVFVPQTNKVEVASLQVKKFEVHPATNPCPIEQEKREISFLSAKATRQLRSITDAVNSPAELYYLRLATIKDLKVKKRANGFKHVQARFERSCNELPMGWLINKEHEVGVVLARFFNRVCPRGKVMARAEMQVESHRKVVLADTQVKLGRLRIYAPKAYALSAKEGKGEIFLDYYANACEKPLGFVYRRMTKEKIWVGILQEQTAKSYCAKAYATETIRSPVLKNILANQTVFPLSARRALY